MQFQKGQLRDVEKNIKHGLYAKTLVFGDGSWTQIQIIQQSCRQ
jgi:hypothetical protein